MIAVLLRNEDDLAIAVEKPVSKVNIVHSFIDFCCFMLPSNFSDDNNCHVASFFKNNKCTEEKHLKRYYEMRIVKI